MNTLKLTTIGNNLLITNNITLTAGSIGVDKIQVLFDSSWTEIENVAFYLVFNGIGDKNTIRLFKENDNTYYCMIPDIVTDHPKKINVGIYALNKSGVQIKVSTTIPITIVKGTDTPIEAYADYAELLNQTFLTLKDTFNIDLDDEMTPEEIKETIEGYLQQMDVTSEFKEKYLDLVDRILHDSIDSEMNSELSNEEIEDLIRRFISQLNDEKTKYIISFSAAKSDIEKYIDAYKKNINDGKIVVDEDFPDFELSDGDYLHSGEAMSILVEGERVFNNIYTAFKELYIGGAE